MDEMKCPVCGSELLYAWRDRWCCEHPGCCFEGRYTPEEITNFWRPLRALQSILRTLAAPGLTDLELLTRIRHEALEGLKTTGSGRNKETADG
jgi:hypothetical protein